MTTPPIIGICAAYENAAWSFWNQPAAIISSTYLNKVREAGGLAIGLIPDPSVVADPRLLLDRIDGLLLIGGADLEPGTYGQTKTDRTEGTAPARDAFEISLAAEALAMDLPVLGICRGLQILNVAAGGTLHQHLLDEGYDEHRRSPGRLDHPTYHDVNVTPDTLAAAITGAGTSKVNSHHHQGIASIGDGASVTARSLPDDLPEALEWRGCRYALGVQWHPEAVELEHALTDFVAAAAASRRETPVSIELIEPATEAVLDSVEETSATELDRIIDRAHTAQRAWAAESPQYRAGVLAAIAAAVDAETETLARMESRNVGMPIGDARGAVGGAGATFRYYSAAPERLLGQTIPVAGGVDMTFLEPIGVVGLITPWNFPLSIASWKVAPALAAGNAVVLKPSELTPLTSLELARIATDAGLPEGLLNVVNGTGTTIGRQLVDHPGIGKIAFTGSTAVGKDIARRAADTIKRVTLELGGKSASIIFADADLAAAAQGLAGGVFGNAGQDCCARSRVFVQRSALPEFLQHLEGLVTGITVGDPLDEATQMGPLISATQRDRVADFLGDAPVLFQGTAPSGPGYWFAPTVLHPIEDTHRAATEEIFGPVVSVLVFDDEDEALRRANDTAYGLAGSVWTSDAARSMRVSRGLQAGALAVNSYSSVRITTPFGGFKQSGLGRELGPDALAAYTEVKNVFFNTGG